MEKLQVKLTSVKSVHLEKHEEEEKAIGINKTGRRN